MILELYEKHFHFYERLKPSCRGDCFPNHQQERVICQAWNLMTEKEEISLKMQATYATAVSSMCLKAKPASFPTQNLMFISSLHLQISLAAKHYLVDNCFAILHPKNWRTANSLKYYFNHKMLYNITAAMYAALYKYSSMVQCHSYHDL